jgi:hypothetical protein
LDADAPQAQSSAVSCGDGDEYPIVTLTLIDPNAPLCVLSAVASEGSPLVPLNSREFTPELDAVASQARRGAVSCGDDGDQYFHIVPDAPLSVLPAVASDKSDVDVSQEQRAAVTPIRDAEPTLSLVELPGTDCLLDVDCLTCSLLSDERKQSCECEVADWKECRCLRKLPAVEKKRRRVPPIGSLPTRSSMKDELQSERIQKLKDYLKLDDIVVYDSCEPMPMWYYIDVACKLSVRKRTPEFDKGPLKCEMPLSIIVMPALT